MTGRQGRIFWAISAFDPRDPFRVLNHDGSESRFDGETLARAVTARKLGPEFDLVLTAKVRPVVLLQDRPAGRLKDFAALPLTRVEKFSAAEQTAIREQREEALFYLGHDKAKYGMDKEYAVQLGGLHRVHVDAIVGAPVGALDIGEFRTVCERLAKISDLDLSNLIVREAAAFVGRLRARGDDR